MLYLYVKHVQHYYLTQYMCFTLVNLDILFISYQISSPLLSKVKLGRVYSTVLITDNTDLHACLVSIIL